MKKLLLIAVALGSLLVMSGCQTDATKASHNLSKAAEMFELDRRIVFYNGITGEYMLTITGKCSVETSSNRLAVTCKEPNNEYRKHYLGLSDNVTYMSEQLTTAKVSTYHTRIIFKPQSIVPDFDMRGDMNELKDAVTPD
jgi:hypothetical protein